MTSFIINKIHLCVESNNALFLIDSKLLDRVVSDIKAWLHKWYTNPHNSGARTYADINLARCYVQTVFENNFHTKVIVSYTLGENKDLYICVMSRAIVDIEIDLQ